MTRILVTSTLSGDGKSAVASGIAAALRSTGATVRLARVDHSDSPDSANPNRSAASDAQQFSYVNGVRSAATPMAAADIPNDTDRVVIEADGTAGIESDLVVLIVRHGEADDDTISRALADMQPDLVIVNGVPQHGEATAVARLTGLGATSVRLLPQDRHLAAPIVRDIAPAIDGKLSGDEALFDEASRDLVIGPVSAHEGMDYFRKYPDKTLITRHDRIDIALGALDYEPLCLILAGGEPTLPYIAQRAERESFALITTPMSTLEAVEVIGPLYGRSAFVGRRKLETAVSLVAEVAHAELLG